MYAKFCFPICFHFLYLSRLKRYTYPMVLKSRQGKCEAMHNSFCKERENAKRDKMKKERNLTLFKVNQRRDIQNIPASE